MVSDLFSVNMAIADFVLASLEVEMIIQAHERFCEDLARQAAIVYLSQHWLGFGRRRIWVFGHRCGVLKAII